MPARSPRPAGRARTPLVLVAVLAMVLAAALVLARVEGSAAIPGRTVAGGPAPVPTPVPDQPNAVPGGPPLEVLGLGDSVVSGSRCGCTDYVTGFGRLLAAEDHRAVHTVNDGVPGATSEDLLGDVQDDRSVRAAIGRADVVVLTIGANDLYPSLPRWRGSGCAADCYTPGIEAMADRVAQIVAAVRARRAAHPPTVLVTDYWNVFTDGDVARRAESTGYLDWSDAVTRAANAAICRAATSRDARCVDLYTPFKGDGGQDPTELLADDGDHPNAAGTALISRTVLAALDG